MREVRVGHGPSLGGRARHGAGLRCPDGLGSASVVVQCQGGPVAVPALLEVVPGPFDAGCGDATAVRCRVGRERARPGQARPHGVLREPGEHSGGPDRAALGEDGGRHRLVDRPGEVVLCLPQVRAARRSAGRGRRAGAPPRSPRRPSQRGSATSSEPWTQPTAVSAAPQQARHRSHRGINKPAEGFAPTRRSPTATVPAARRSRHLQPGEDPNGVVPEGTEELRRFQRARPPHGVLDVHPVQLRRQHHHHDR